MTDPLFDFMGRYIWLLAIPVVGLNTFVVWRRASAEMAQKPDLQEGYRRLISGYAAVQLLPWLVMGLGIWVGGVPTIWYY